ncbi:MAG: hypothetical protein WC712_01735 [Candidatus Brocadiia bacterium]
MAESNDIPTWAPRLTQNEVRRLYGMDARGIYDEDLINDVGFGLMARCESFIAACEACAGRARCPSCRAIILHSCRKEEPLHCGCGWQLTWGEYFGTIQHAQLSGAEPVLDQFRAFMAAFPAARTSQEKMLAIDQLIHGFHVLIKTGSPTRPVAVNLIEGRLSEVVDFLDQLAYSDLSTPGIKGTYSRWNEGIEVNRGWYPYRKKSDSCSGKPPEGKC